MRASTSEEIAGRTNGLARGMVPLRCEYVTAMIDMHDQVPYWSMAA